jgi:hypothetical protein
MPAIDHFVAATTAPLPRHGWAVLPSAANDTKALLSSLDVHQIEHRVLVGPAHVESTSRFETTGVTVVGTRTPHGTAPDGMAVEGSWSSEHRPMQLPAGTIVVPGEQRRLRLAAQVRQTPTAVFSSCIPVVNHGRTCIVWANLTPFSPGPAARADQQRWDDHGPGRPGAVKRP